MKQNILTTHQKQLRPLIKQYGITYLALFGSYSRGEQTPDSDVDLLVDFEKDLSFSALIKLEDKLRQIINRKVDVVPRPNLDKYIRPYIQDDLQVFYEKTA